MGVLCTEKHCSGERCACGGVSASSPRPATLTSFPASPCENSSTKDNNNKNHVMSRKRSLDTSLRDQDDSGIPVVRRRTQRSPSAGSLNGIINHVISKEKLNSEISAIVGQNGFKHEHGVNGLKLGHNHQNGTRPLCCLGLDLKAACIKCVAHHHPTITTASTSPPHASCPSPPLSLSSSPQQVTSSSASLPCDNGKSSSQTDNASSVKPDGVSSTASTTAFLTGSNAHPVTNDTQSAKRPQPPSSLSPLAPSLLSSLAASSVKQQQQQQQLHQPAQGPKSSVVGSSSNKGCSNSSSNDDMVSDTTTKPLTKCISASPNSTVLNLRQRLHAGANAQKSYLSSSSLPASPQGASSSSSSLSKSKFNLSSSSSSPSLSTLTTEPSSPSQQPSTVQCKWRGCSCDLDASDLLEHIRKHAEAQIAKETYACLWTDCKVFNKPSWSGSWLERHIVSHSGHRPFKCILDNCGQRFHSQAALERHVNGHFTANGHNGAKTSRSREEINHRMLQRRRRQLKRRSVQSVRKNDFFDEQTMAVVKQELLSLADHTQIDISGSSLNTTFQGLIIGRRTTKYGSKQSLVEFIPSDVLEDEWVPEEEATEMAEISVPLSGLPHDTVTNIHTSLYRRHRFRKHRRK